MGNLNIINGNILDNLDNKDLIVNSANQYMICGSGVCGVIYKKANKELLEDYCKQHYRDYKSIISVSLGTGVHGYKHNDIAKGIVVKLNELVKEYNIDFTLVLPNEEINKIYVFKNV